MNTTTMPACFRCDGTPNRIAPRWEPMTSEESVMNYGKPVAWNRVECGFYGRNGNECRYVQGPCMPQDPDHIDILAMFAESARDQAEYARVARGGSDLCI